MSGIRITNPRPGGPAWTSKKSARGLVRRHQAQWTDESRTVIALVVARVPVVAEGPRNKDRTGLEYDRISRRMEQRELRHIPLVGPNVARMLQ